ncbi:MAG: FAD/NAD(P)-binding protein, partial [Gemmatimonadaceae bacterium]
MCSPLVVFANVQRSNQSSGLPNVNERTIVIVGAGFSGTIVAAHLLRRSASTPLRVILIDRLGVVGKGVAYSTTSPGHLLNVPAGRMSAFPADEDDFLRFARERVPGATGGSFLLRLLYGEYLDVAIRSAAAQGAGEGRRFEAMHDEVVGLEEESAITTTPRTTVRLASGAKLVADRVVLALGNYPPADPPIGDRSFYASRRYIGDPWASGALQNLDAAWGVLLVGTGLTMLDVALQLSGTQARGRLVAMSRRGLVPHPHRPHGAPPSYGHLPPGLIACEPTAAAYLRSMRRHARTLEHDGVDWREIMASLRPLTPRLWETLSIAERGRFLRHARTYWDTHRHRVATDVWQRFDQLQR